MKKSELQTYFLNELQEFKDLEIDSWGESEELTQELNRRENLIKNFLNDVPDNSEIEQTKTLYEDDEDYYIIRVNGEVISEIKWDAFGLKDVKNNKNYMVFVYCPSNNKDWEEWLKEKEENNISDDIIFYC